MFSEEKEGEKEFKTFLGGFISIGMKALYLFCCVIFIKKMVTNEENRI